MGARLAYIPRRFKLVNRTWKVEMLDSNAYSAKFGKEDTSKGSCSQDTATISLNVDRHADVDDLLHTFYHELFHALLYAEGCMDHNEEWVDRMGGFLHQILHSMGTQAYEVTPGAGGPDTRKTSSPRRGPAA